MADNKDHIDLEGWDLFRAAEENRVDIARALIVRGDDVDARDEDDDTPCAGQPGRTPSTIGIVGDEEVT